MNENYGFDDGAIKWFKETAEKVSNLTRWITVVKKANKSKQLAKVKSARKNRAKIVRELKWRI